MASTESQSGNDQVPVPAPGAAAEAATRAHANNMLTSDTGIWAGFEARADWGNPDLNLGSLVDFKARADRESRPYVLATA
jgi:hypothetical protein